LVTLYRTYLLFSVSVAIAKLRIGKGKLGKKEKKKKTLPAGRLPPYFVTLFILVRHGAGKREKKGKS